MTGTCERKVHEYLVNRTKNSRAQGFDFPQLRGLQNAGVNFGTFLPRAQRFEALPMIQTFPGSNKGHGELLRQVFTQRSHLSALQIPPHGSLAANS